VNLTYVEQLRNEKEWETYVHSSDAGSFYHTLKWKKVIERSFPYSPLYLVIKEEDGRILGVSPGFIKKSFRTAIYDSTPHSDYGGPIIDPPYVPQASRELLAFLNKNSPVKGLTYAKFRIKDKSIIDSFKFQMGQTESEMGVMEIDLSKTPTQFLWNNIFSSNRRKKFRQMERRGFQARIASTKSDLRIFYDLYSNNMMHIGANPHPFSFMENIWDLLYPSHVRIWILEKERPLAAKLIFRYEHKSFSAYVGIDRDRNLVNTRLWEYLTWSEIKAAEEEGVRYISLGATPSDSKNKYFSLKLSMGCVFHPQAMIWSPLNSSGRVLAQTRFISASLWRHVRPSLPSRITRILESKLGRF
jgi:hypothetical protein